MVSLYVYIIRVPPALYIHVSRYASSPIYRSPTATPWSALHRLTHPTTSSTYCIRMSAQTGWSTDVTSQASRRRRSYHRDVPKTSPSLRLSHIPLNSPVSSLRTRPKRRYDALGVKWRRRKKGGPKVYDRPACPHSSHPQFNQRPSTSKLTTRAPSVEEEEGREGWRGQGKAGARRRTCLSELRDCLGSTNCLFVHATADATHGLLCTHATHAHTHLACTSARS